MPLAQPIDHWTTFIVGLVIAVVCAAALWAPESRVGRLAWRYLLWEGWGRPLFSPWTSMVLLLVMGVILMLMGLVPLLTASAP